MSLTGREDDLKIKYQQLLKYALQLPYEPWSRDRVENLVSAVVPYICHGGSYDSFQLKNTCVLDGLLSGIHFLDMQNPQLCDLFSSDQTIHAVLRFMYHEKYNEAKTLWLINLSLRTGDNRHFDREFVDIRGYVRDHLPNFADMAWASSNYDTDDISLTEDRLMESTLKAFREYGDVMLLCNPQGNRSNQMVLVDNDGRMDTLPPLSVKDDYGRTYSLWFLLLGDVTPEHNHMLLYVNLFGRWTIFDAAANPAFKEADRSEVEELYFSCLAVYIMKERQE